MITVIKKISRYQFHLGMQHLYPASKIQKNGLCYENIYIASYKSRDQILNYFDTDGKITQQTLRYDLLPLSTILKNSNNLTKSNLPYSTTKGGSRHKLAIQ